MQKSVKRMKKRPNISYGRIYRAADKKKDKKRKDKKRYKLIIRGV